MTKTEVTYSPSYRNAGFTWGGFSPRAYFELLSALVWSQMKMRYQHALIGFGWAFLNPVLQMLVYAYVFGSIFTTERANFRLFLLAGLLPWQAFSLGLTTSVRSLLHDRDLLRKAPFPSELLPIGSVVSAMVNLAIVFTVFLSYLTVRGFPVLSNLHWLLVALAIEIVFLIGLSLLVSPLNVFYRDIEQLLGFAVWIWFFLTPIVYPLSQIGRDQAKVILALNPMAGVVSTIQNALLYGQAPPLEPLLSAAAIASSTLAIGWWLFRRLQYELPKLA